MATAAVAARAASRACLAAAASTRAAGATCAAAALVAAGESGRTAEALLLGDAAAARREGLGGRLPAAAAELELQAAAEGAAGAWPRGGAEVTQLLAGAGQTEAAQAARRVTRRGGHGRHGARPPTAEPLAAERDLAQAATALAALAPDAGARAPEGHYIGEEFIDAAVQAGPGLAGSAAEVRGGVRRVARRGGRARHAKQHAAAPGDALDAARVGAGLQASLAVRMAQPGAETETASTSAADSLATPAGGSKAEEEEDGARLPGRPCPPHRGR